MVFYTNVRTYTVAETNYMNVVAIIYNIYIYTYYIVGVCIHFNYVYTLGTNDINNRPIIEITNIYNIMYAYLMYIISVYYIVIPISLAYLTSLLTSIYLYQPKTRCSRSKCFVYFVIYVFKMCIYDIIIIIMGRYAARGNNYIV